MQTNELATVLLSCSTGTKLKFWGFLQRQRLGTGPVSQAHTAGTTQSRKVYLGQLPSKLLANNFQTGCNIDQRITTPSIFDHQHESNIMLHFWSIMHVICIAGGYSC